MKKIRKALSVLFSLLIVFSSLPIVANGSSMIDNGTCGGNTWYNLYSNGDLEICGFGNMNDYSDASPLFDAETKSKIRCVIIENAVNRIGENVFANCENLTSIVFYGGGQYPISVGDGAFRNCDKLTSVLFGNRRIYLEGMTFGECDSLTSVTIDENVSMSRGSAMSGAFYNCSALKNVNVKSIYNIGEYAFELCKALETVSIAEGLKIINRNAFRLTTALEKITFPSSITKIESYAFNQSGVNEVTIKSKNVNLESSALSSLGTKGTLYAPACSSSAKYAQDNRINFVAFEGTTHSNLITEEETAATCTEKGYTGKQYCSDCSVVVEYSTEIPSLGHGHTLGFDEISAVPATCTADGNTAGKYCKDCGVYYDGYEVIASEGHKWSENYVKKDKFNHGKKCSVCGEFSELAEHESELVESIPATCVSEGIKIYQCVCGYEYLITIPVSSEHQWGEWFETAAPTCTEAGSEIRRCTVAGCSKSEEQTVAALGHTLTNIPMVDSTCEKEGTAEHYKCNVCGNLFSDEEGKIATAPDELVIAKKAHTYTKYEIVKNATCTEKTLERAYCDACNKATDERYVGELLPHVFKNYVSDKNATCIEDGTLTAVCENCKTATDTVADTGSMATAPHTPDDTGVVCKLCDKYLGCMHTYTTEKFITRTPTCTANGVKAMYCTKCYINKPGTEEILPATGHSWDAGEVIKESSCSEHGLQIFRCKNINCEAAETKELPLAEHNYKEEIIEATCTEDGYSLFTCTECKSNYVDKAVKAYGHMFDTYTYDEGTATCYKDGTKTSKCANACGATKTITDEGSKIDHVMNEFKVIKAADCLNDGEEEARCLYYEKCGYSELVPVDAYGHDYVYNEGYEATCTEDGRVEGASCIRCNYGADILVIPARGHDFPIEWSELLAPDCLSRGVRIKICNDCNYLKSEVIPQTGHYDDDSNSICDICNKDVTVDELEPSDEPKEACDCNCHAGGIKAFFFNFINFFAKIFDKDARTCKCGKSH